MVDGKAFLVALRLADSFFPSGMYAHSHGLEPMVSRGLVTTVDQVEEFLVSQLEWSALPSDGVALLNAYRSAASEDADFLKRIDQFLWAMKLPSELRTASGQLGRRLLAESGQFESVPIYSLYSGAVASGDTPGNGAVALGVIAYASGVPMEEALLVFCHSHAASVLGAAMRLMPVSHSDAQSILGRLYSNLSGTISEIWERPWDEMISFSPVLDVLSMCHERDNWRLFAS